ncbi:MAG TPA: peptidylprolyl isomerase [Thermoanaerobaculia bacterium]|jgi:cyclophilin family peptidyl-prolyl cis-trans isomerase/HEAT repeat protein|nr:peptidylprolyl isomerase [Thermoanaerobaculia bacterium]
MNRTHDPRLRQVPLAGFLLALALSAVACTGSPRPRRADTVSDLDIRSMLLLLVDRQIYDPTTVQIAASGGPGLREELAVSLGRVPSAEGRPVLLGMLEDAEPAVRRAAAFALGEMEDEGAKSATSALLHAAVDADRETGRLAVEALGKIGADVAAVGLALAPLPEPERWARLTPSLFRFKQEERVPLALAALGAESRRGDKPGAKPVKGAAQPDPQQRFFAAYALARDPFPSAAEPLRGLLNDPDPRIRGWAARALGQIGTGDDLVRLLPLLAASELPPVIQALRAGQRLWTEGKITTPEALAARDAWRAPLLTLISDARPGVRSTAIEAAAFWLPDPNLSTALGLRAEQAGRERGLALVALATGKDPHAAELIARATAPVSPGTPDGQDAQETLETSDLRAHAAEAAGKLGDAGALDLLWKDPSPTVRGAVAAAWLEILPPNDAAAGEKRVTMILTDPDEGVRLPALDWLGEHPVLPMAALGPAVAKSLVDESEEPGLAGLRALGARVKAVPAERVAVLEMAGYVVEKEGYVLRRAAIELFKQLEAPAPELLPPDDARRTEDYGEMLERVWPPHRVAIETEKGTITVDLTCRDAPLTCLSFLQLIAQGFYDGLTFHRVVPDFVIQGGDPRGDGIGGPGYSIRDEIGRLRYDRGVLGMALAGPDTGGSQFFLTLSPQPHLDGGFTSFGKVVAGDAVLDQIQAGDRIVRIAEVPVTKHR